MTSKLLVYRIMSPLIVSAGLAGCAQAPGGYRIVTTPGPRGTIRAVENEPRAATPACSTRPARFGYRVVTTPGPRGTTRVVRVPEAGNMSDQRAERSCD